MKKNEIDEKQSTQLHEIEHKQKEVTSATSKVAPIVMSQPELAKPAITTESDKIIDAELRRYSDNYDNRRRHSPAISSSIS